MFKWFRDIFINSPGRRVDDFADVAYKHEPDDALPSTWPEALKQPAPIKRFAHAAGPLAYDKLGRVIDCRMVQTSGCDAMHLAVQLEDLTDGCQPMISLVTNRFEAPLAQVGDRVRVAFRTEFKIDPVYRHTEVSAFFICWADRLRRTSTKKG
jgi:hypothetical protein